MLFRVYGLLVAMLLTGCSVAPVQEMSDARQAIQAAKQAGAQKKSPGVFSEAQKHLDSASTALHQGRYKQARSSAIQAKTYAIKAHKLSIKYGVIY